jgi:uncharacterized protein YrrD
MIEYDFNFKAEVHCRDGQCGKLTGVVVNPEALQVTDLIVESGFFMKQGRVLPLHLVERATEESIYLSISTAEVEDYPGYYVMEYDEPVTGLEYQTAKVVTPYGAYGPTEATVPMIRRKIREGIVSGQQVIEEGMPVNDLHNAIGKIDRVVVDGGSEKITHLVVHRGLIFKDQLSIPFSMIENIGKDRIFVSGLAGSNTP